MTTHYDTLGVTQTSTADEIKKAYRKLASQNHPDKGGDTAKFQEIQSAYDTLSDDAKRQDYDDQLAGRNNIRFHFGGGGPDMNNINDLFAQMHRQFGGRSPFGQQKPTNRDIRIQIQLNAAETLSEQVKTLNMSLPSGPETIELKIPAGVTDGATIRYPGLGDNSIKTAERGDLIVHFSVVVPPGYQSWGEDLVYFLSVNCIEAMVGCNKEVEGIDGKTFSITIPKGIQFGTKLGIPNQGLFSMNSNKRGRLIVTVEITTPTNLTTEQVDLLKATFIKDSV